MFVIFLAAFVIALILFLLTQKSSPTTTTPPKPPNNGTSSFSLSSLSNFLSSALSSTTSNKPTKKSSTFQPIPDKYKTIEQLQEGLKQSGLESSNLIIGIDYTKSNTWTGRKTFGGKCLHHISSTGLNPYQTVISIMGKTLEAFDDDKLIPAYGFGDRSTSDRNVFPFFPDGHSCYGFNEVLTRYNELTPRMDLAGPTSFAPIIREAIRITKEQKGYNILLIIADGQVTNVEENMRAIVECSKYPISIILIGVGDGPWDLMEEFDDGLPTRNFDNFQFVNFTEEMTKYGGNEVHFAMSALMEIPDQFLEIKKLNLFNNC